MLLCCALSILNYFMLTSTNSFHCVGYHLSKNATQKSVSMLVSFFYILHIEGRISFYILDVANDDRLSTRTFGTSAVYYLTKGSLVRIETNRVVCKFYYRVSHSKVDKVNWLWLGWPQWPQQPHFIKKCMANSKRSTILNFFYFIPMKISQHLMGSKDRSKFWWSLWFPAQNNTCLNICNTRV